MSTPIRSTHLRETPLLDWSRSSIRQLVAGRNWRALDRHERIGAIYRFVRDEIRFGYNRDDAIPASQVLADGYGQCNTKATLLMALLRAAGVPCRLHGATIHKSLQKGVVTGLFYRIAPSNIFHTWVEVELEGNWLGLEGVILDRPYIDGLRRSINNRPGCMLGYAVGTDQWENPAIDWVGSDTAIQRTGVNGDFGIYDDPDAFYAEHGSNLRGVRKLLFRWLVRHRMNRRVAAIRSAVAGCC